MSQVSAVKTTGIYCLPRCGAQPYPGNVMGFSSPSAAESAGYRACLRCRPYREAPPSSCAGPELVCRAVNLVLEGALDQGTGQDLGDRLGVSPRHLRRLFGEHLGVTPDQLARSSRAHFARRLLDDTDLTITEIALAAGFGSLRQFNRTFRDVFRSQPGELRLRRRRADRLVADGGLALRLAYRPPLDWTVMVRYLERRAIPGVESVGDGAYRRTVLVGGAPGVLEFRPGDTDHLLLRAHLPHWQGLIHLVQQARRIFNLDSDLEGAYGYLRSDPVLGLAAAAGLGARVPGAWDPFEVGISAILGDRLTEAAPSARVGRLVERFGVAVPGLIPLGLSHLFPTPACLAAADLSSAGLSEETARTVSAFAAVVLEGTLVLDRASGLDPLLAALTAIPGLDAGAAHYLALRMGEPDAFPWSDAGIRLRLEHRLSRALSPHQVGQIAEAWRPWRAQAATLLAAS
ncbi:MAG: AlkA N-terminal domain-containing protein [Candidatus Dormibacteria bacterium]